MLSQYLCRGADIREEYGASFGLPVSNTDPDGLMPQSTLSRGLQSIVPIYFDRQFGTGGPTITWRPSALEQAQTSHSVNARANAAGQFALGFIPGYDLYRAATNPNANALDWTAGVLGVLPGLGKGAALGAKGIYAAVPLLGGAVREVRAVEAVAKSGDNFVNLASPQRTIHIPDGDATGRGHLFPGAYGKSPFPQEWSRDRIMHEISDVATDPASMVVPGRGGRSGVSGTRYGVDITVILESQNKGGGIVTGFPTNVPRNPP